MPLSHLLIQINPSLRERAYSPRKVWLAGWRMPSSTVRTFTDADAYFAGIRNLQIDGLVTQHGTSFRAEATLIDLQRLQMGRFDEALPQIKRVTPSGSRVLLLFATDPSKPPMLTNGIETSHGQAVLFGLGYPYYLRSLAANRWGTLSLQPQDLATAAEAVAGRDLTPPAFMHPIKPPVLPLSRLQKLHEATGQLAKTAPGILAKPEVTRAMEQALVKRWYYA